MKTPLPSTTGGNSVSESSPARPDLGERRPLLGLRVVPPVPRIEAPARPGDRLAPAAALLTTSGSDVASCSGAKYETRAPVDVLRRAQRAPEQGRSADHEHRDEQERATAASLPGARLHRRHPRTAGAYPSGCTPREPAVDSLDAAAARGQGARGVARGCARRRPASAALASRSSHAGAAGTDRVRERPREVRPGGDLLARARARAAQRLAQPRRRLRPGGRPDRRSDRLLERPHGHGSRLSRARRRLAPAPRRRRAALADAGEWRRARLLGRREAPAIARAYDTPAAYVDRHAARHGAPVPACPGIARPSPDGTLVACGVNGTDDRVRPRGARALHAAGDQRRVVEPRLAHERASARRERTRTGPRPSSSTRPGRVRARFAGLPLAFSPDGRWLVLKRGNALWVAGPGISRAFASCSRSGRQECSPSRPTAASSRRSAAARRCSFRSRGVARCPASTSAPAPGRATAGLRTWATRRRSRTRGIRASRFPSS